MTDKRFRQMMERGDVAGIGELLADDVLFHSPVLYRPFEGRELVNDALQILRTFFSDATYTDEFRREGKTVLMFTARIKGRDAEGVQQLLLDKDGRIRDLKVWLRPLTAAFALSESMAPHLEKTEDGYAVK
jgi:SnoaL-like domain